MKNITNFSRYIVEVSKGAYSVFIQKKTGEKMPTLFSIDELAMKEVERNFRENLMFLGIDPDKVVEAELPKGLQVAYKKELVARDNAEMAVVKKWASMMAQETNLEVCFFSPTNILARP